MDQVNSQVLQYGLSEIRPLDPCDIKSILARNSVGRLGFVRSREIDIIPIQYVYREGCIYGRTASGGKLEHMSASGTEVAFEVDEIRSTREWRSVLTHGTFEALDADSGSEEWVHALGIVRTLHKSTLRRDDPRPDRTELFRITVRSSSGRALG